MGGDRRAGRQAVDYNTANIAAPAVSWKPGRTVTMSWPMATVAGPSSACPSNRRPQGTDSTTRHAIPAFCQNFVMPSAGTITVTSFVSIVTGGIAGQSRSYLCPLTLRLDQHPHPVEPVSTAANSGPSDGQPRVSGVTIPAGQNAEFRPQQLAARRKTFTLAFDSVAKPSKITLPTTTVINVYGLHVYDAPVSGGQSLTTPVQQQRFTFRAS